MDHALSIETKAAERYLLGELRPPEVDAFERHFFECPECAGDVCAGSVLVDGARAFYSEAPVETAEPACQTAGRRWRDWFALPAGIPAAAAFALLTFTVYQNAMLLPGLRRAAAESALPQVLASAVLAPAGRSGLPLVSVPASASFFQLSLALPPAASLGKYDCDLRDDVGRNVWSLRVAVPEATEELNLLIPAGRLAAGTYAVVLHANGKRDSDPFRFRLIRQ